MATQNECLSQGGSSDSSSQPGIQAGPLGVCGVVLLAFRPSPASDFLHARASVPKKTHRRFKKRPPPPFPPAPPPWSRPLPAACLHTTPQRNCPSREMLLRKKRQDLATGWMLGAKDSEAESKMTVRHRACSNRAESNIFDSRERKVQVEKQGVWSSPC